ncbi:hypothetical protein B0G73_112167 [Paraburkholderia sp. BL25I1N1]|nr:hypothetical protein B0G73_112167 [Paraburkholderia sp. BL25I1N1]
MRLSGFVVRKFRPATLERAFRMDYARRYAGQRRLASTLFTLAWIGFSVRDYWWRTDLLDPGNIHHLGYVRLAGAVGMAVPVWLMWGARASTNARPPAADLRDGFFDFGLAATCNEDTGTLFNEPSGSREANTAGAARDDSNPVFQ